jgi:glutathione reductase (NADPH)
VGDVTDRINLTPVAIREGAAFAQTEFYDNPTSFDHDMVASAVFSQPPIGVVGLTEADARHQFGKVDIYRAIFRPMKVPSMAARSGA